MAEQDNAAAGPGHDLVDNKDLPALNFETWVVKLITVKNSIANNRGISRSSKDPGEKIPPPSKPATNTTSSWSSCDGGPVVH